MAEPIVDQPDGETPAAAPRGRGAALLVATGILLSRIIGLVRERVFAHYFGNSDSAGAFKAAQRIPNALQNLFGEGVLSAAFIPVYSRLLAEGDEKLAGRVAGAIASIIAIAVAILVLLGVIFAPALVGVIAFGFKGETRELTITLVRVLFPGIGLLVLSAWCLGVLNSHRKFFVPYVAPVLWSLAMITAMVLYGGKVSLDRLAVILAWGAVVGSFLQFGIQIPFVLKHARDIRIGLEVMLQPVRLIIFNTLPIVLSRGVVQISAFVDESIASKLGEQALSGLAYAQTLYMLPISLFAMSVAAAELPEMSSATGTQEEVATALRKRLLAGQRQIAFFVIPSIAAFILIGRELVAGLFQTGNFGLEDTLFVWYVLMGSTVGLLAVTLGRLFSSGFYALRDTRTPLRFAIVRVVLTAVLGVLFAFPLRPYLLQLITLAGLPIPEVEDARLALGAVGLTVSAGIAGWVEFVLLRRAMKKRIQAHPLPKSFLFTVWGAAIAAAGAAYFFGKLILPVIRPELPSFFGLQNFIAALVVSAFFGLVYFAIAALLRIPETDRLKRMILRR